MKTDAASQNAIVEALVREAGLGRLFDLYGDFAKVSEFLLLRLGESDALACDRFPDESVRLSLEVVTSLYRKSPAKGRAFIEQLFFTKSPEMLLMVWRLLNGAEIGHIDMQYDSASLFHLRVTLRVDREATEEAYSSDDIADARLFHHFGNTKINGKLPVFLGFYARFATST